MKWMWLHLPAVLLGALLLSVPAPAYADGCRGAWAPEHCFRSKKVDRRAPRLDRYVERRPRYRRPVIREYPVAEYRPSKRVARIGCRCRNEHRRVARRAGPVLYRDVRRYRSAPLVILAPVVRRGEPERGPSVPAAFFQDFERNGL